MFAAVLFIIATNQNQLKCPPKEKYINILWYIHTDGTLQSNKRVRTTDTCKNVAESHKHYVKKTDMKNCLGMIALYEVKEQAKGTNSDESENSGYLWGSTVMMGVLEMYYIVILLVITWMYSYVKFIKLINELCKVTG